MKHNSQMVSDLHNSQIARLTLDLASGRDRVGNMDRTSITFTTHEDPTHNFEDPPSGQKAIEPFRPIRTICR